MLKKITEVKSVATREKFVREVILDEIKDYITSYRVDAMGNLIVYKKSSLNLEEPLSVMMVAHMDEVGLVVTEITDDGLLKFDYISIINLDAIVSKRVKCGDLQGVVGSVSLAGIPIAERCNRVKLDDLFIDIGAISKEDAEQYVMPGDVFSFVSDYVEFGDGFIKALALDNRVGCAIMMDALKGDYNCDIVCLFTAQEETAMRGAKAAAFGIKADFALNFDTTLANDTTGVPSHMMGSKIGKGAEYTVKGKGTVSDLQLVDLLKNVSEQYSLPLQMGNLAFSSGDLLEIATANGGTRNIAISVPARYAHTPVCVISNKDFCVTKEIVKMFLHRINSDMMKGRD